MKIAIVIGHDSTNKGAYGNEGVSEFDFNVSLMQGMATYGLLPQEHELYIMYRSSDIKGYTAQMRDLHKRIDVIGCEISIELHFNSFSNEDVKGHEVLYCSDEGRYIAEIMNDALDAHLPTSNRGIKRVSLDDRGGGFCCRGKSKAIILEPYFGSSQSDFIYGGKLRKPLMLAILSGLENL